MFRFGVIESVKAVLPRQRELPESTTAVRNDQIDEFLQHLNKQNAYADIQFTKEMEENGKTSYVPLFTEDLHRVTDY